MAWAPDYITTAELKAFVRISDSVDDAQVAWAVTAASRAVDTCTGRQFGQVSPAAGRVYTAEYDRKRGKYVVPIDDVTDVTSFVLAVAGSASTDYTLEPRNAVARGLAWTQLVLGSGVGSCEEDDISVTALWGWSSCPVAVKQATALQASRFLSRRDSPYGVAGSPDTGGELRLLASVDPDVKVALRRYVRVWAAV